MTTYTEQLGQDSKRRISGTGQSNQGIWDKTAGTRTAETGPLGQDHWDREDRIQDSRTGQYRKERTGWPEHGSIDRAAEKESGEVQPYQDSQGKTTRAGHLGHESQEGQQGWYMLDRKAGTGLLG